MFFDELDSFLVRFKTRGIPERPSKAEEEEDIIDELLDLYLLAYFEGSQDAARELLIDVTPSVDKAEATINRPIEGKTFEDRVREYINGQGDISTVDGIARVAETDSVRIYNEAKLTVAKDNGAKEKTWHTMGDNKVRDTHEPLDGVKVPIDADFYTWDFDQAPAPGQFGKASNNVNCRCWLTFNK